MFESSTAARRRRFRRVRDRWPGFRSEGTLGGEVSGCRFCGHVLGEGSPALSSEVLVNVGNERLRDVFIETYPDILAFAARRCDSLEDAEDVVAETFAVACRRLEDLPGGNETRLWLFGTARLIMLAQQREGRRGRSAIWRLARQLPSWWRDETSEVDDRDRVRRALTQLSARDREVLQMHVWDGLAASEIAAILEVSTPTIWKRLQRARDRLAEQLDSPPVRAHTRTATAKDAR